MKQIIAGVFLVLMIVASAHAEDSLNDKLVLARTIWEPAFSQVKYQEAKAWYVKYREQRGLSGPGNFVGETDFEKSKELVYETFAEVLAVEDLKLQQRLFNTSVGKKMLSNIPRAFGGLPQLLIAQNQFTVAEWKQWEKFATTEQQNMIALQKRMDNFSPTLIKKQKELSAKRNVQ